jgi:hypothetical protein
MIPVAKTLNMTNKETEERRWTEDEKRVFDVTLRAFARWEVDYANLMIRAVRCEGRTEDPEQICKMCRAVIADESFKRAVRRVCVSILLVEILADSYLTLTESSGSKIEPRTAARQACAT